MLLLLLACGSPSEPSSARCEIATVALDTTGGAGNRAGWRLTGGADTVLAEASWYGGAVVSQTIYSLPTVDTVTGAVSFLPYATDLDLQRTHGDTIDLTLTAMDAAGEARCSWSGSLPFFTPEWSGRAMTSFSVSAPESLDATLADTYLLAPYSEPVGDSDSTVAVMLYSGAGDVVGMYRIDPASTPLVGQTTLLPSGADLRRGSLVVLTEGVPGLTVSSHCRFFADSARLQSCDTASALFHHGLFLSDSGTRAFSSQWQEDADGPTAIALPAQLDLTAEAEAEVIFDIGALLGVEANYENSFTRSPRGADDTTMACATDHVTLPGEDTSQDIELAVCYGFDGENITPGDPDIIVSETYAQQVFERLSDSELPLRVLPGEEGVQAMDFLHDLKRVRLADRHRVFVYNLGHFDPVHVRVYDFPDDGEAALRCTAVLPEDDGTLYYGSVVLPRHDATIFGAYAATGTMDLRWYDAESCAEVAAMISDKQHSGSGLWMTPVAAADLYSPGEEGEAAVSAHHITYRTVNWSSD